MTASPASPASPAPASPAQARLWLTVSVLTCCLAVYVITMPLVFHGAPLRWPLAAVGGLADLGAIIALAVIFELNRASAAVGGALADRDRQAAALAGREQALLRESAGLRAQCADQQAERERLQAECERLQAECEKLRTDIAGLREQAGAAAAEAGDRQESMRAAVVALSRRVQTSAHRIQEEATLMADRHPGDAAVLEVSMRVDHAAAQQARHAQSIAVLCGEWPAQQWPQALPLAEVVRAAAGRIAAYQRIEVTGDQDVAAAAPVVEPLIHLVAELLANATQSSPPMTQVPVTVRAVQRGAVIEIHDCGVGLDEHRLAQVREIAAGTRVVGLDGLGEIPQTGLPVVGQYVRRHGFRADLSESVYGGVRAVVGIPADSVETVEPADALALAAAGILLPDTHATGEPAAQTPGNGLPRRRPQRYHAARRDTAPEPTPQEAGAWMGAFLSGEPGGSSQEEDESTHDHRGELDDR